MSRRSVILAFGLAASLATSGMALGHVHATTTSRPAALKLVHSGYLTVGTDATYPPMESVNPQTHQFVGNDIDLGAALAKAMHLKVRYVNNAFDSIIPALTRGNFDVIMSSMSDTSARRLQISFVDYMLGNEGIVVKSSSSIKGNSYAVVCGRSVAVQSGTTELFGMQAQNKKCKSKIDIKPFTADTAAFQAFVSGHADAYSGDYVVCALYIKQHSGALRLAGNTFSAGGPYGIGLLKSNAALKASLTAALHTIRTNGQYKKILKKWGVLQAGL